MDRPEKLLQHLREGPGDDAGEATVARRETAAALRELCHAIGASRAAPDRLREVAAALRVQGRILAEVDPAAPPASAAGVATVPGMHDFHDRGPIAGRANPLAPPAVLGVDRDASIVVGEVTFGPAFEGAPGIAHGGFVAAVLDEALGMASAFCGRVCMTAELVTRYRRHTPIGTPLRIEARLDAAEGRRVRTSGELSIDGTVIAEARGLFVAVGAAKFDDLVSARAQRGAERDE